MDNGWFEHLHRWRITLIIEDLVLVSLHMRLFISLQQGLVIKSVLGFTHGFKALLIDRGPGVTWGQRLYLAHWCSFLLGWLEVLFSGFCLFLVLIHLKLSKWFSFRFGFRGLEYRPETFPSFVDFSDVKIIAFGLLHTPLLSLDQTSRLSCFGRLCGNGSLLLCRWLRGHHIHHSHFLLLGSL